MCDEDSRARGSEKGQQALDGLFRVHGKRCGHAKPITDVAYSGDVLASKDPCSMRLWRAGGDYALLRVVTCPGKHVRFHHTGQFIVTGTRLTEQAADANQAGDEHAHTPNASPRGKLLRIWGPAAGSAVGAGKKKITTGAA